MRLLALFTLAVVVSLPARAEAPSAADLVKQTIARYAEADRVAVTADFQYTHGRATNSGTVQLDVADATHGRAAFTNPDGESQIAIDGQRVTKWWRDGNGIAYTDLRQEAPALPAKDSLLATAALLHGDAVLSLLPMDSLIVTGPADANGVSAYAVTGTRTLFASTRGLRSATVRQADEFRAKETVTLTIAAEGGRLLKEEMTRTLPDSAPQELQDRFAVSWSATYKSERLGAGEGAPTFVLDAPEGAKRVASLTLPAGLNFDPWSAGALVGASALVSAGPWGGAPDFSLEEITGGRVQLSGLQGKIIFLDFWATWCPPCRESLPHTQKLSQMFPNDLVVLTVDVAETDAEVQQYVKQNYYTFRVLMDRDGAVSNHYGAEFIPTFAVIDRTGKLIGTLDGWGPGRDKDIHDLLRQAGLPIN